MHFTHAGERAALRYNFWSRYPGLAEGDENVHLESAGALSSRPNTAASRWPVTFIVGVYC